jgi:hypothetical protein
LDPSTADTLSIKLGPEEGQDMQQQQQQQHNTRLQLQAYEQQQHMANSTEICLGVV